MGRPRKYPQKEGVGKNSSTLIALEKAFEHLHARAVRFDILPGERINEMEVAEHLHISRAPVREALNRLVMNGLMDFEPGRGFFGRKLRLREISELCALRADLELPAVRAACKNASDENIAAMAEAWDLIVRRQDEMDIEELVDRDERFHLDLAGLAGNNERIKFMKNVNERIHFVRRINLETEGRRNTIISEHSGVLAAIADRDEDNAVRLMGHHLDFCPDVLKSHVYEGIARIYADEVV